MAEFQDGEIKFVVDVNLGKLAHYLLLLGFDTKHSNTLIDDAELAEVSATENRILLTRDRGLLKRKKVTQGYFVHNTILQDQVVEVLKKFNLLDDVHLCTRCTDCNVPIHHIDKARIQGAVPPLVFLSYKDFYLCPDCGKIYWKGTHYENLVNTLEHFKDRFYLASDLASDTK